MSYESPIELITSQYCSSIEDAIYQSVLKVGIDVDKEELIKALEYDRGQYKKGYDDRDAAIVRCKDCKYRSLYCTEATDGTTLYTCHHPCSNDVPRPFDWYCADGERKEGRRNLERRETE